MSKATYLFIYLLFFGVVPVFASSSNAAVDRQWNEDMKRIGARSSYEKEARKLMKLGDYDEAFKFAEKAMNPDLYVKDGWNDTMPQLIYRRLLWIKGDYQKALKNINDLLAKKFVQNWEDEAKEFEADLNWQKTGDKKYLYDFVAYLKQKHSDKLPPKGKYAQAYTEHAATQIIRTYDLLGDYEVGIEFVDSFSKMRAKGRFFHPRAKKNAYTDKDPYYQVRKAFEQDKAEGKQGCPPTRKPGEYCVGRATKVLIESKKFTM